MATKLKNLRIDEISAVDRGACRTKDGPLATTVLVKRDFSQDERDHLAETGAALPDGSFPIKTAEDLKNAIRAIGLAKNPTEAKTHIISRARSLGLTRSLPEDWNVSKTTLEKAADVLLAAREEDLINKAKGQPTPDDPDGDGDDDTTMDPEKNPDADEDAELGNLRGAAARNNKTRKARKRADPAGGASEPVDKGEQPMTEDVQKALDAATAEIAKLKEDLAKATAELEKAKKPADPEETEEEKCQKALAALPDSIKKQLAEADEVKKRVAALEEEREVAAFTKRATDVGLGADFVPHLRTIAKADPKAAEAVEGLAKQLQALAKESPAFKELGATGGPDVTSAAGQLDAKAGEIAKRDGISKEKAFAKAVTENPDIYNKYQAERSALRF